MNHNEYSVIRNFICGGHIEQKYCKMIEIFEKRYLKFLANNEIDANIYWDISSLGCHSVN